MSLLNSLVGGVLQQMMGGQNAGLMKVAMSMLGGGAGGGAAGAAGGLGSLGGLVEQFTKAGLGQQAQSWVGTGANMPISADDIMKVFGQGQLQQMASQAGMQPQEAAGGLASMLPELVNQLTPKGQIPQANELEGLLGSLRGMLK